MKIIVIARTRNEELNIERFCRSYSWANRLLIADGGSEDKTKELATQFPNVSIRDFTERIQMDNGLWRNPHGRHLNFLIDWATQEGADYIIHDDVDSVPNPKLQMDARNLLDTDYVYVTRLYLWGETCHFPRMSLDPKGGFYHSIWAWRATTGFRYKEDDPLKQEFVEIPKPEFIKNLEPPNYCLLHRFCPTPEVAEKKTDFYRKSGEIPYAQHPLYYGGDIIDLPDWAKCV